MTDDLLLDTCALIWLADGREVGAQAEAALDRAARARRPLRVSAISAWELGMLAARGRIALSMPPQRWFARALAQPGVALAALEPDILVDSAFLPGEPPPDPADRIVIATARAHGIRIVTRDARILGYAAAGHVAAIAC